MNAKQRLSSLELKMIIPINDFGELAQELQSKNKIKTYFKFDKYQTPHTVSKQRSIY
jgi:hypothetical protein